jgi:hypothetical protein
LPQLEIMLPTEPAPAGNSVVTTTAGSNPFSVPRRLSACLPDTMRIARKRMGQDSGRGASAGLDYLVVR